MLILWALLLFGGFFLGSPDAQRRMPLWTRMASSATLVIAAFSWFLVSRDYSLGTYGLLIALGMVAGFAGDLALSGLLSGGRSQIAGIAAFGVGHLFYIIAIWHLAGALAARAPAPQWGALAGWWLFAVLAWYFVVFRGADEGFLHWVVLPYALLLATTAGVVSGLALQVPAFAPLALGAALFLFSDLLLGGIWFSGINFRFMDDVVWLTYGPAPMLIVFSVGAAIQVATQRLAPV